jgi:hypothetical protein
VKDKAVVEQGGRSVLLRNAGYQTVAEAVAGRVAVGSRRVRAARGWYRKWSWVGGWIFAGLTLAPALLAVAWLLPGTGMLLAGRLLPAPMLIIFIPLAIALCYFAMRQLPTSWPRFPAGRDAARARAASAGPSAGAEEPAGALEGTGRAGAPEAARPSRLGRRSAVPAWAVLLTLAVAAGFTGWQVLERSQQAIVATSAGGYLQYAYWIAHHGTARIPVLPYDFGLPNSAANAVAAAGVQFTSPGFLAHGSTLSPAFMAGLPLVLAGGIWAHGVSGAFLVGPVLGGCAILSFAGLAGRLVGPRWAPAAALVLAVVLPEQYVSRTSLSEPLVQILLFGGLCLVLDSLAVRRHRRGIIASPARDLADAADPDGLDDPEDLASLDDPDGFDDPVTLDGSVSLDGSDGFDDPAGFEGSDGLDDPVSLGDAETSPDVSAGTSPGRTAETSPDVMVIAIGLPDSSAHRTSRTRTSQAKVEAIAESRVSIPWQAMTLAGLGGLALGLALLADIGSLSIVLPVFPFLAIMFVARRPQAAPLAAGLLVGIGLSVLAAVELARPYLSSLGPQLHDMGLAVAGFGIATALIAPLAFPPVRAGARRVVAWRLPLVGLGGNTHRVPLVQVVVESLAALVPVAALIGLAIRPSAQVTRAATDPYYIHYVASLQRLAGLAVDGRQQYYEQSLNWVIWYVGLPAVLLACGGAALLARRCVRALLHWQGAPAAARSWGLPLVIFGWSTAVTLWDPAIYPDQPWASRRLVPVALPGLICLALWVCSRVRMRAAELGAGQAAQGLVVGCSVLALVAPAAVTTFDPGYVGTGNSRHLAARGMALVATIKGEKPAVSTLCAAIDGASNGGAASVIIVDQSTASAFTQVVRGMCDVPTARMDGASPALIEHEVAAIERAGRRPVLLGSTSASVDLIGAVPQRVLYLSTTQDAQDLNGPPAAPWPLTYSTWMASPTGA